MMAWALALSDGVVQRQWQRVSVGMLTRRLCEISPEKLQEDLHVTFLCPWLRRFNI